ncbi:MAG TPA: hypothetical protein VEB22_08405 [Phycisphaerales bacterium]|nr:hypothetical protein [Phycisphaerales bacterium]
MGATGCLACGYDLSASPELPEGEAWKCPECGRVNTREDLRGETGWPPGLARAVALVVLTCVNVAAGFFLGFSLSAAVAGALAAALCVTEVGVLYARARRSELHLAWGVLALFTATLALAGWLGVGAGVWLARTADC